MPWKKDESGVLAMDNSGNPVWVSDSGEETGVDYGLTQKRLGEVNAESKKRKEELRAMRERFAALDGIEDIAAYRLAADKALEAVKNQTEKDKELEAQIAGRVEAATSGYKNQISERDKKLAEQDRKNQDLQNELNRLKVSVGVKGSKTLAQRLAPEDRVLMERVLMRAGFISEEGKVQFRDDAGEVYLNDKYEPCNADEAVIEIMKKLGIDPEKKLLSLDNSNGSGGSGTTGMLPGQKNPWKKETWNVTEQCRVNKLLQFMSGSVVIPARSPFRHTSKIIGLWAL